MKLSHTRLFRVCVVAVLSLALLSGVAAATTFNGTAGDEYTTDTNLTVVAGEDYTVGGDPYRSNSEVVINNVSFSAPGQSGVTADDFVGTTTELSGIDAQQHAITVDPEDKTPVRVSGGVDQLSFEDATLDDNATDFTYQGSGTVAVGGFSSGKGVVAVNATTGDAIDSDTAGSDGFVSFSLSASSGGVKLQSAPSALEIRDETDRTLIQSANSTIEFYPQGDLEDVITRNATNGSVDMSGLPNDEPFVAVASADGYVNRRIFVDSLIETRDIYLPPNTADTVEVEFELEDFSGEFGESNTVLQIERSINGEWTPVEGDFFGATGRFDSTLLRDERHRLTLVNVRTGTSKRLGQFTPQISGVQTVTVKNEGDVELGEETDQVTLEPPLQSIEASENATFGVQINKGESGISDYQIVVEHIADNGSATQLAVRNGSGGGTETFDLNLSGLNGSVQATVEWTSNGETKSTTLERSIRAYYPGGDGLLDGIGDITAVLTGDSGGASGASTFVSFILALLITVGVATSNRSSPEVTGLASLGSLAGFNIIGWLPGSVLFAAAVAFAVLLIARRRL